MKRIVLFAFMALLFAACRSKDKPLPVQDMKLVMFDMMKADELYTERTQKDTGMERRGKKEFLISYSEVFKLHGITREKFYDSYKYYAMNPAQMKVLMDSIDNYANRERNRISENYGQAKKK